MVLSWCLYNRHFLSGTVPDGEPPGASKYDWSLSTQKKSGEKVQAENTKDSIDMGEEQQRQGHVALANMVVVGEQPGIYQAGALGASQQ